MLRNQVGILACIVAQLTDMALPELETGVEKPGSAAPREESRLKTNNDIDKGGTPQAG